MADSVRSRGSGAGRCVIAHAEGNASRLSGFLGSFGHQEELRDDLANVARQATELRTDRPERFGHDIGAVHHFFITLSAKTGARRGGIIITYGVNSAFNAAGRLVTGGFSWNDTTTNITSLRMKGDRSNAHGVGTRYHLYKIHYDE